MEFKNNILKNGNKKLKNMLVYSHAPIKGCLDCSSCASTCYAVKSYKQYPNVKSAWDRNLKLVKNNLDVFKVQITKELVKTRKKTVRIHSSGDFISQAYIEAWAEIAEGFPEISFYTYTKSMGRFDFTSLKNLSNVNIIDSFLPNGLKNYGSLEYCLEAEKKYDSFICPATLDKNVKCGEGCNYCVQNNNVVFLEH